MSRWQLTMKLYIDKPYLESLVQRFPDLDSLLEQLKFGHRVETPFTRFTIDQLDFLSQLYQNSSSHMAGHAAQIKTLTQALSRHSETFAEGQLESLIPMLVNYLLEDGIKGWLFKANGEGKPIPYLVGRIDFTPPGEEEAGRILLDLKANAMAKLQTVSLMIMERDIVGKSLPDRGTLVGRHQLSGFLEKAFAGQDLR